MRPILLFIVAVAGATAFETGPQPMSGNPISIISEPRGNFCGGCRSIISYLSRFNESGSRDAYKDLFNNFCELYYPVSTDYQQGPCPLFVKSFFYVIERIDPIDHCDQIGACGSFGDDAAGVEATSLALDNDVPNDNGPVCKVCRQVVQQVKEQLEDPDFVKQVQERIDAFCSYLKAIGQDEVCKQMLRQNLDEAIEFIEAVDPVTYCEALQLCTKGKLSESDSSIPTLADFSNFGIETSVEIGGSVVKDIDFFSKNAGPSCIFCKKIVVELFKFLKDNSTEENIRYGLDQICVLLYSPGANRDQCDQLVATYSKEFVDVLTQETDPELICTILQQCYNVYPFSAQSHPQLADSDVSMSEFISMLDPTIAVGSMRTCVECKLFVSYLQGTLDDKKSQEELEKWLLENLCENLGDESMKSSCKSLIEKRAPDFFKAIADKLDPRTTCKELGACGSKHKPTVVSNAIVQPSNPVTVAPLAHQRFASRPMVGLSPFAQLMTRKVEVKKPITPFCEGCVTVVGKIDEYLSAHTIQYDVDELITEVCDKLPVDQGRKGCTSLIKYYGQEIMQHISTMSEPRQLCTKIQLC